MAQAMTYTSLVSDVQAYCENTTTSFASQVDRFIMSAENRIASEARGLGFINVITDNLVPGDQHLAKPARWRETYSFQIGTVSPGFTARKMLLNRPYEYLRSYWPDATQTKTPKYYADWDYQDWLIAPTPDVAYPYECIYHERPIPLDSSNQTNWTTQYAPQLILYACLLEAQPFLKRDDRMKIFQDQYDRALKQVEYEQKRRMQDRAMSVANAV